VEPLKSLKPTNDILFRKIFTSPDTGGICLKSLLNAILKLNAKVENVQVLDSHTKVDIVKQKRGIVDVKATDSLGRQFNVEVQLVHKKAFKKRLLFYWSKLYTEKLMEPESFHELHETYSIAICDFVLFPEIPGRSHLSFSLREDRSTDVVFSEYMKIHILELPNVQDQLPQTLEDAWLLFFRDPDTIFKEEIKKMDSAIRKAYEIVGNFGLDPNDRAAYGQRQKDLHDYATDLTDAMEQGIQQGIEKG
jgi:predicted transposase/invertase (TIGR01784 family)